MDGWATLFRSQVEGEILMKKIKLILLCFTVLFISACQSDSNGKTQSSSTEKSISSAETSSSVVTVDGKTIDSSDIDDSRKINPSSDVAKLRRNLYQAGVNSSGLTDKMLEKYQQEAQEANEDVVAYIKSKINK